MSLRSLLYRGLRASNDVRAVRRSKVPQRLARRALGRVSARLINKIR